MAPRKDIILFCDLETTGTDEVVDGIIEVGISVWTWPGWRETSSLSVNVLPNGLGWDRMNGKDVIREMHKANGLYDELAEGKGVTIEEADDLIDTFLLQFGSRGSSHIPLAGSGVLHFDRRFIKRWLPKFDARLTHWAYDVGVLRRMYELAGEVPASQDGKTHRALDDARVHAAEFRFYMDQIADGGKYRDLAES